MPRPTRLFAPVVFDQEVLVPDGFGGFDRSWQEVFRTRAEFRYDSGDENVQGGGLTGTALFKVKIRAQAAANALTVEYRMRDLHKGLALTSARSIS